MNELKTDFSVMKEAWDLTFYEYCSQAASSPKLSPHFLRIALPRNFERLNISFKKRTIINI